MIYLFYHQITFYNSSIKHQKKQFTNFYIITCLLLLSTSYNWVSAARSINNKKVYVVLGDIQNKNTAKENNSSIAAENENIDNKKDKIDNNYYVVDDENKKDPKDVNLLTDDMDIETTADPSNSTTKDPAADNIIIEDSTLDDLTTNDSIENTPNNSFSKKHEYSILNWFAKNQNIRNDALVAIFAGILFFLTFIYFRSRSKKREINDKEKKITTRKMFKKYANMKLNEDLSKNYIIGNMNILRFKSLIEDHGDANTDKIIKSIKEGLLEYINQFDMQDPHSMYSTESGEFWFFLVNVQNKEHIKSAINKINQLIHKKASEKLLNINFNIAIGIAISPQNGTNLADLMHAAFVAKNRQTQAPNAEQYKLANHKDIEDLKTRMNIIQLINSEDQNKIFQLYYQPVMEISKNKIVSFECLLRLNHPTDGIISPGIFIPAVEQTQLIFKIGEWVRQQAVKSALRLPENIKIAFNVSPAELINDTVVMHINQLLKDTGINPGRLEMEITESMDISQNSIIDNNIKKLNAMGLNIVIDDFGSGYSNFDKLSDMPYSKIKLDMSIVNKICNNKKSANVVNSIIKLAKSLNMKVTAEGVENIQQAKLLKKIDCDYLQGYLIGKPSPKPIVTNIATLISDTTKDGI